MDWNSFGRFIASVAYKRGVFADFLYAQENERLLIYTIDCKTTKLYKAFGYDWDNECTGEVQWDGKCFFMPEGTRIIKFVIIDERYVDMNIVDEAWEMANGL